MSVLLTIGYQAPSTVPKTELTINKYFFNEYFPFFDFICNNYFYVPLS